MKMAKKFIIMFLMLALCASMVITAFALNSSAAAGIYGTIQGSSFQKGDSLVTSTWITKNPDRAFLQINIELQSGGSVVGRHTNNSSRGITSHPYTWAMVYQYENEPNRAYCAHCVQGGTQSEQGYAVYTYSPISIS